MDYLAKNNYFLISDHSLFEIYDYLDRNATGQEKEKQNVIDIINKYEILLLCRDKSEELNDNYEDFTKNLYPISKVKEVLHPSFSFSLSTFLANIYSLSVLTLANNIDGKYDTAFYNYIRKLYANDSIYEISKKHLEIMIAKGYLDNQIIVDKYVKKELKDLILRTLTYHKILETNNEIINVEFNSVYNNFSSIHKNHSFKEIILYYIKTTTITINAIDKIDRMELTFIQEYIKDLIINNGKFSINDLVDYLNFQQSYEKSLLYFTLDDNSLNKYKKYFILDQKVLEYIREIEKIKDIPYNTLMR